MSMAIFLTSVEKMLNDYADVLADLDAQDLLHHVYDEDDDIYACYDSNIDKIEALLDQIDYLRAHTDK